MTNDSKHVARTFYQTVDAIGAGQAVHCLTENLTRRCDLNDIPSRKLCEL
jgi:hypothetical protein